MKSVKYQKLVERPEPTVRFGQLETSKTTVTLPAIASAPRTKTEALAIGDLTDAGVLPSILSPYASRAKTVTPALRRIVALEPGLVQTQRPLVLADPEIEALNLSCVARSQYEKLQAPEGAIKPLWDTTMTKAGGTWRRMMRNVGIDAVVDYMTQAQARALSDVRFLPTPIITADPSSVSLAFEVLDTMLKSKKPDPTFELDGLAFLFHAGFWGQEPLAEQARQEFLRIAAGFRNSHHYLNKIIAMKVYHNGTNTLYGSAAAAGNRMTLSAFTVELADAIQAAGGVLVGFNWGYWAMGLLDSAVDVVTVRLDGQFNIETPMKARAGARGPRKRPNLMAGRSMVEMGEDEFERTFRETGSVPLAPGLAYRPVSTLRYTDAKRYAAHNHAAHFNELGRIYREAGLDEENRLAEAVQSILRESPIASEIEPLCASLRL